MTTETTPTLTEGDLAHFTESETWYRSIVPGVTYTDGAKFVADRGGAYWLLDKIATMQLDPNVRKEEFQHWKLLLDDDQETRTGMSSAVLTCDDGNGNIVYREVIDHTDFPLQEINFWYSNNVIYLPSEH